MTANLETAKRRLAI